VAETRKPRRADGVIGAWHVKPLEWSTLLIGFVGAAAALGAIPRGSYDFTAKVTFPNGEVVHSAPRTVVVRCQ
jgi:hypothetical protein